MTRNVLLVVHLSAVAAWLGANILQFVVAPRFRRVGGDVARQWTETARFLGQRYYNVVGLLVGASGLSLVFEGHWKFRGFVLVGIGAVLVGAVLGIVGFDRLLRRELAAMDADDTKQVTRLRHNFTSLAVLDTLVILVAMLSMIDHWKGSIS